MDQVEDVNLQASECRTAEDLRGHLDPVGLKVDQGYRAGVISLAPLSPHPTQNMFLLLFV